MTPAGTAFPSLAARMPFHDLPHTTSLRALAMCFIYLARVAEAIILRARPPRPPSPSLLLLAATVDCAAWPQPHVPSASMRGRALYCTGPATRPPSPFGGRCMCPRCRVSHVGWDADTGPWPAGDGHAVLYAPTYAQRSLAAR